ncbi:MAG: ATP-grasp domain-containing protein [Bacteroides sp.]|nr:ATP-grasp domain-containing protein [Bacteroides sp.]
MSRLLIIGASILQLPAIKKAKELGHYVAVADLDSKAIGIEFADVFYNVSTIDVSGVTEAARHFKAEGIMTLATDMPMRAIAAATTELSLPGISPQTALNATDKEKMIEAFKRYSVASPWYFVANHSEDLKKIDADLEFPCIMKPVDSAGSRGVVLVEDREKLHSAYEYSVAYSKQKSVIIEEYMSGNEVSVEIIITDGNPHILAVTDKLTTGVPHFVEMGHSQQSQLPSEDIDAIKQLACSAVRAIGINTGPAHVEIMLTPDGPKLIELGARMGGDCITTHLVPLSTGIDMIKATIDLCLGMSPDITPRYNRGSAIRFFNPLSTGTITSVQGVEKARTISGIKELVFTKELGQEVDNIRNSTDRVGYVISQSEDAIMAVELCEKAIKEITIKIE